MKFEHFLAFLWLRGRLRLNQLRKGGLANVVILVAFALLVVGVGLTFTIGGFFIGFLALAEASPRTLLFVWDGILAAMLFFWCILLLTELQRSDALTLDKVLHLPVSPSGAFVVNYLSSLINVTLILFVSGMFGLTVGLVCSRGPSMLLMFPLIVAFVLALTAATYQFQGWLASLMTNPRRRRTIIVLLTAAFILIIQIPNIINFSTMGRRSKKATDSTYEQAIQKLNNRRTSGEITQADYDREVKTLKDERRNRRAESRQQRLASIEESAWITSIVLPPGWVAVGAASVAEGSYLPAILGTLGLGLLGSASLWRAYRTTLKIYLGTYSSGSHQPSAEVEPSRSETTPPSKATHALLERQLPWLPEQAAAVALSNATTLIRAPEVKMVLLSPLFMIVIFGTITFTRSTVPPLAIRPTFVVGAVAMILVTMMQLASNQFGLDRAGFRVLVLSPASRRDVLLGKNVSLLPLLIAWGTIVLITIQAIFPMRWDHFLAAIPQILSAFLLWCMVTNWLSIFAPIPIAPGTLKPSSPRLVPVLLNLVGFFFMAPLFSLLLIPLGLEMVAEQVSGIGFLPLNLILSLVGLAMLLPIYFVVLNWQGRVLQSRELEILKVVTAKE